MFEFNGWAVVEADHGGEDEDRELMVRLQEHVAGLPEGTRESIRFVEGINGFQSVLMSGLRNHGDPFVAGVLQWLAEESKRAYGLLYVRNAETQDMADIDRFFVWRLEHGTVTYHRDALFT